jgi:thiosulfate/3-mercaptopyruvate sulfurtransferase
MFVPVLPALVSPEELADHLGDESIRIFDATVFLRRETPNSPYRVESGRATYEQAHLPGAAFADIPGELSDPGSPFPFTLPTADRFAVSAGRLGIGDGSHVVAYAQGSPMWATRMWWLLRYFGHDGVSVLDGGLIAWLASGGAVEGGDRRYPSATFTARPRPERLAPIDDVAAIVDGTPALLVNALPEAAFRGDPPGSYSRPGRIPGSVNLPSSRLLDPVSQRFLPSRQIEAAFADIGVDDQPVVAYCGGGISATIDLFALSLTGRDDARLYDGSLSEWSADPDRPLITG